MSAPRVSESDALRLSAYLDGELPEAERADLERRLEREAELRAELDALRAGGVLVRSAGEVSAAAPSRAFAAFRGQLAQALPAAPPVAAALEPPRLRRLWALGAALVLVLALLHVLGKAAERLGGPRPTGWWGRTAKGSPQIGRGGRMVALDESPALHFGDVLYVDADGAAEIFSGAPRLQCRLTGPAVLGFEANGLLLEEGRLEVQAEDGAAARKLKLRTPDGAVQPRETGPFQFTVEVKPRPKPER